MELPQALHCFKCLSRDHTERQSVETRALLTGLVDFSGVPEAFHPGVPPLAFAPLSLLTKYCSHDVQQAGRLFAW